MGAYICVTYNLWKNEGRFAERLDRICASLAELDADFIALQECFFAPDLAIDVAQSVSEACSMHLTRMPQRAKARQHGGQSVASRSELALLSRTAPDTATSHALPADARDGERGLLIANFAVEGGRLRIGCTHLTHLRDDAARTVRRHQAGEVVSRLLDDDDCTALLMGDLNAHADAPELGSAVCHPRLHEGAAVQARKSAACDLAGGALDHALLYPAARETWLYHRQVAIHPDAADPDAGPSDHPAIMAHIERIT